MAPANAEEGTQVNAPSSKSYILNLDKWLTFETPGSAGGFDIGSNTSPSGLPLPGASANFTSDDNSGKVTYFTPRFGGLQITWSGDQSASTPSGPTRVEKSPSETFRLRPRSVGAVFTQQLRDVELSVGGDYGTTLSSVPGAVGLAEDESLLRLGAHARFRDFVIGGMIGSNMDGSDGSEPLSWNAFGRYQFGDLSIGMAYSYMIGSEQSGTRQEDVPGTLQAGLSYTFTPNFALTSSFVYGSLAREPGTEEPGVAGMLGFSLDF